MKFFFNTRDFELSHGRTPKGLGSWAFQIRGEKQIFFSPSMTYGQAKTWVKSEIRSQNPDVAKDPTVEAEVLVLG